MDKQNEIENIVVLLSKHICRDKGCNNCEFYNGAKEDDSCCVDYLKTIAEIIINAGYGNVKETITEFIEWLIENWEFVDYNANGEPCITLRNGKSVKLKEILQEYKRS